MDKLATGGLGGLIGRKKGAVAMRMTFKRVRMLFISCHLSGKFFFSEKNLSCDYSGLIYFCLDIC